MTNSEKQVESFLGQLSDEKSDHVRGIDFLRGIAISGVVVYHLEVFHLSGGVIGVDLFMVISGFLVTRALVAESFSLSLLKDFYVRRILRIFPPLALLVATVLVSTWALPDLLRRSNLFDLLASILFVANWRFVATGTDYFQSLGTPSLVQHLWSLSIEEQFYLVWPLLILLVPRFARRPFCLALCVLLVIRMSTSATELSQARLYFGTDTRAQALVFGALIAIFVGSGLSKTRQHEKLHKVKKRSLELVFISAVSAIAYMMSVVEPSTDFMFRFGYLAAALLSAIAVLALVLSGHQKSVLFDLIERPIFRALGKRSYSLYLFHWPIVVLIDQTRFDLNDKQLLLARVVAIFLVSEMSYRFVENRFRFSKNRSKTAVQLVLVLLTLALITALLAVKSSNLPDYLRGGTEVSSSNRDRTNLPSVRFIGDSIVASLESSLLLEARKNNLDVETIAISGCGLLPGLVTSLEGQVYEPSRECDSRKQKTLGNVTGKVKATVWLSAWDTEARQVDGELLSPTRDPKKIGNLYFATAMSLLENSDVVYIVTNPVRAKTSVLNPTGPEPDVVKRQLAAIDIIQKLGNIDPRIRVLDLSKLVCDTSCTDFTENGDRFRPTDGIHFEGQGAEIVADWLIGLVLNQGRQNNSPLK
jgi:peptidoglycan/LPS O-acetylase OafA/YrhL